MRFQSSHMVVDQEELDSLREKERLEKIEKEWKSESQAIQRHLPRPFEINSQVWVNIVEQFHCSVKRITCVSIQDTYTLPKQLLPSCICYNLLFIFFSTEIQTNIS